jgi:hypothetical protein
MASSFSKFGAEAGSNPLDWLTGLCPIRRKMVRRGRSVLGLAAIMVGDLSASRGWLKGFCLSGNCL